MRRIYFIVNLVAGKAEIGEHLGEVIEEFNKSDFEVVVHVTQNSMDAIISASYACENNFDMIVCAGGDGTLSQCIQGVIKSRITMPVGYIPAGSTNDFARSLGIPRTTMEAVGRITSTSPTLCDIGQFNDSYFTYIVAFGAFTNVTYETSQQLKNTFGHSAYIVSGLMQLTSIRSKHMRIEYDGNIIEDEFIFGMVTNSASVAGLLSMNDFLLDDGMFEVTLIKKPTNIMHLHQIISSLINISEEIDKEYIKFFRTDKIVFTSLNNEPITWTRDGEYGGNASVNTITCLHKAIPFFVEDKSKISSADVF